MQWKVLLWFNLQSFSPFAKFSFKTIPLEIPFPTSLTENQIKNCLFVGMRLSLQPQLFQMVFATQTFNRLPIKFIAKSFVDLKSSSRENCNQHTRYNVEPLLWKFFCFRLQIDRPPQSFIGVFKFICSQSLRALTNSANYAIKVQLINIYLINRSRVVVINHWAVWWTLPRVSLSQSVICVRINED